MEEKKSLLEMAVELDGMERDTTSAEADLLDRVLPGLRAGRAISPKDAEKLGAMHTKYFAEGKPEEPEEEDQEDVS